MPELTIDLEKLKEIGLDSNVKATIQDGKLVLVIDLAGNLGPSSSGKMIGVGSTGGFQQLPGGLKGNIYIGRKAE